MDDGMECSFNLKLTQFLNQWLAGDEKAIDQIYPHIHAELYLLARRNLQKEFRNQFSPTELINEMFLKLCQDRPTLRTWECRRHFFNLASLVMRHVLHEHAKRRNAQKRNSGYEDVSSEMDEFGTNMNCDRFLQLEQGIEALAKSYPRHAEAMSLHYFLGLKLGEVADVCQISYAQVRRDIQFSKAWLSDYVDLGAGS